MKNKLAAILALLLTAIMLAGCAGLSGIGVRNVPSM